MHLVVVWWPKLKRVLPEVSPVTAWHRNMCVVFFRKSWEKSPRFAQHGDTVSTTPWRKLPMTDVAKDCFCHCRDASEKLVDFTKASWQTPKKAAEVRRDDMYDVCQGLIIVWSWSAVRMMKMLVTRILVPLDLNSSKARGVGLFHSGLPTTDLQRWIISQNTKKTLWNLETLSWSAYQCLVLIVCEDQELTANEVFCHLSCYTSYSHPEKLQRIQDATPPATDSATAADTSKFVFGLTFRHSWTYSEQLASST